MKDGKYVILLDAGHYAYYNQGAIKSYWESLNNWTQHLMLKEELEKRGFVVYTTRTEQENDLALYDRGYQVKKYEADLFLSIHSNAPGGDHPEIRGIVVNHSVSADAEQKKLANMLAENLAGMMSNGINGVYPKKSANGSYDYYGVLRGATAGGCTNCFILERGFHTNTQDCEWLLNESNLRSLAVGLANMLEEYYYGGSKKVRRFELLSNMNIRQSINGTIVGVMNAGEIVEGTELETASNGTVWLYNTRKVAGWVAVLPESKGYAKEIVTPAEPVKPDEPDYKALYEAEQKKTQELIAQVTALKNDNAQLKEKLAQINKLSAL